VANSPYKKNTMSEEIQDPELLDTLDQVRLNSKFTVKLYEEVLENIHENHYTISAIESAGISARHFYRKIKDNPELVERFQAAQLQRDKIRNSARIEKAETELSRRAVEGWAEPVYDIKGNHCGDKQRYSDACLIFMLKKLKPEVYADTPQALVQNNVNIVKQKSNELLNEWREMLGAKPVQDAEEIPR
tara:strand:+ start:1740 stop:2306 length:567 start_codon:yes stop_codon:yes gene_type:complete